MLLRRSEDTQSGSVRGISSSFNIELLPQPPNVLRLVIHHWKHPAKKEQIARLHRLDVSAERRWRGWQFNAKILQPLICTARL